MPRPKQSGLFVISPDMSNPRWLFPKRKYPLWVKRAPNKVIYTTNAVIFTPKSVLNQHLFVGKSADVAQLAEQVFCKHQVAGSRPCRLLQLF